MITAPEIPGAYLEIDFVLPAVGVGVTQPVGFQVARRSGVRKDRPVDPHTEAGRKGYEPGLVRDDRKLLRGNDGKESEDQDGDEAAQGKPAAGGKKTFEHKENLHVFPSQ